MSLTATFDRPETRAEATGTLSSSWMHDRLSPTRALTMSLLFWAVLYIVAPVEARWPSDPLPVILLVAGFAAMYAGMQLPAIVFGPRRIARPDISPRRFRRVFSVCLLLAAAGVACRYVDLFIFRDVSVTDTIDVARDRVARHESSIFSVAAMPLAPFAVAALTLAWAGKRLGYVRRVAITTVLIAFAVPLATVLLGSRSGVMILVAMIGFNYIVLVDEFRLKTIAILAGGSAFMLLIFNLIFILRAEQTQIDLQLVSRYSAYTQMVPASPWFLDFADGLGDLRPLVSGFMSIVQYSLHGVFEFFYLVELKQENFTGGTYTFFFMPKVLAFFSGQSTYASDAALDLANPRSGVFQTFMGPAYVDFGWFSIVFAMVYGACADLARRSVLNGNVFALPLYILFLQQIIMAPFVNLLVSANGLVWNIVFTGVAIAGSLYSRLSESTRA